MNFRVGQKVVCVHRRGSVYSMKNRPASAILPEIGAVYTIRVIRPRPAVAILLLHEIDNSHLTPLFGIEPGFNAAAFRPVVERKTDISIFTEILDDVSKQRELHIVN